MEREKGALDALRIKWNAGRETRSTLNSMSAKRSSGSRKM